MPSPSPGARQNILYGVTARSARDVWAVGATQDGRDLWHTLAMHWDGDAWSIVPTANPGPSGNLLYAVSSDANGVYAVGQQAGTGFPGQALVEQWDGSRWTVVPPPFDRSATDMALGVTVARSAVTVVGDRETGTAPYTTFVASGTPRDVDVVATPNAGAGENDLFGAATAADGTTWSVGWEIDPSTGNHRTLVEKGVAGRWSLVPSPNPNAAAGDVGLSSVAAVPGGGLWAVGVKTNAAGNYGTLILHHR